ncbi:hypothetical protein DKX38_006231 [Salix brachista]|uniref:Reverse transcriptase zinc-binding domain-containing protein n=1 Tax=Salix brachista TaxID=2182728 RepID=A0A5N5N1I2_9ROSI|nr:hypothetical protein DKX38_006231 [Salix brachista]
MDTVTDVVHEDSFKQIPRHLPSTRNTGSWAEKKKSMIGFFVSYRMPFHAVQTIANRGSLAVWWEIHSPPEMAAWFQFDKNKIRSLPVWARLQGLPFPLWNKQGLSLAASMVGKPIACDEATLKCSRMEYARVCIELDAAVPPVHQFKVASPLTEDPITVEEVYEWKPARCHSCRVFGHSCKGPGILEREKGKAKMQEMGGATQQVIVTKQDKEKGKEKEPGEGQLVDVGRGKGKEKMGDEVLIEAPRQQGTTERPKQLTVDKAGPSTMVDRGRGGPNGMEGTYRSKKMQQGQLSQGVQGPAHEVQKHTDDPPQCIESGMASISARVDSDDDGIEATGSSIGGGQMGGGKESNTPSPKMKKKKGKKKKGGQPPLGVLESRISATNMTATLSNFLPPNWEAIMNIQDHPNGRIIVGWNAKKFQLKCIASSAQWLTCEVQNHSSLTGTRLTFVYGLNTFGERTPLWRYIKEASEVNINNPWAILGDFNATLRPSDRSGGSNDWFHQHNDFPDCITRSSLYQVPYSGMHLSWHNGQASDHCAMVLRMEPARPRGKPVFKFLNQWTEHDDFQDIVLKVWQTHIVGNPMFQLTSKLSILKHHLRDKHKNCTSHISHKVFKAQKVWNEAQLHLDGDPQNAGFRDRERQTAKLYMQLCKEEEAFFKQCSRVQWLKLGDHNTKFFHRSLVHRNARGTISSLRDEEGRTHTDNQAMGDIAVGYFKNMLQMDHGPWEENVESVYRRSISPNDQQEDKLVWIHSASGVCSIKSVWELFRSVSPQRGGCKLIWHGWHIPRHSFVLWLASKGRLRTIDRFHNQILPLRPCMLCERQEETHDHLFFKCRFSAEVWKGISQRAQVLWPNSSWEQAWDWAVREFGNSKLPMHRTLGLVLAASVYHLWTERNHRLHDQHYSSVQQVEANVFHTVRERLANLGDREGLPETVRRQWEIH